MRRYYRLEMLAASHANWQTRIMSILKGAKLLLTGDFAFSPATIEREFWFIDCLWINFRVKEMPFLCISSPETNNAVWRAIADRY